MGKNGTEQKCIGIESFFKYVACLWGNISGLLAYEAMTQNLVWFGLVENMQSNFEKWKIYFANIWEKLHFNHSTCKTNDMLT